MDTSYGSRTGLRVANLLAPLGARVQRPCTRRTIDRVRSMYNTISITHERRTESLGKLILSTHCFEVEPEHQVCNRLWILKTPKLRISYSPTQDTTTTVLNRVRALPLNHLIFEKETKKQFSIRIKKCMAKHENTTNIVVDIRYR